MRYLLLLYGDAAAEAALGPEGRATMVEEHRWFSATLRERGAMVLGEALEGPEETRTIRFDGDSPIVTDGPFLESRRRSAACICWSARASTRRSSWRSRCRAHPGSSSS